MQWDFAHSISMNVFKTLEIINEIARRESPSSGMIITTEQKKKSGTHNALKTKTEFRPDISNANAITQVISEEFDGNSCAQLSPAHRVFFLSLHTIKCLKGNRKTNQTLFWMRLKLSRFDVQCIRMKWFEPHICTSTAHNCIVYTWILFKRSFWCYCCCCAFVQKTNLFFIGTVYM